MKAKKGMFIIIGCSLILLLMSIRLVMNTSYFLEGQIRSIKHSFVELVTHDKFEINGLAKLICKEAEESGGSLFYDKYRSSFPTELENHLLVFLDSCPMKIDDVYVGGQTVNIYPEGACVFRCTIERNKGVYAWVDLIYVPSSNLQNGEWYRGFSQYSEQITDEWYIVILYGF